ncbi:ABC transporter substrate-binding protein [Gorillibacterium sp. sgz5001074]|uniref:ABC transporter substrate-binding protein n=1 Tax=Gorillibacterium sp. sgz5001074 TaxID=3446695 RepID=UPI003F66A050
MKRKIIPVALTLTMLVPTTMACTKSDSEDDKSERVLRVATSMDYGDEGEYFRQQFTEIFEFANPNIKIEYIPTSDNRMRMGIGLKEGEKMQDPFVKLKEIMAGENPPDVVMFNLTEMRELVEENLLEPLDARISKEKFDTSDIVPAVMDGLKSASTDGKLYALSPTFSSSALIYNRKMFDQAGVPYPTDNMTWDQVFDLARRVSTGEGDKRVYGFNFFSQGYADFMSASQIYAGPLGLQTFDEKGEKLLVDSDQWEKVWATLIQLEKDKVIPGQPDYNNPESMKLRQPSEDNPFAYHDFLSGRLAMSIMQYGELSQIDNANKNAANYKNFTPVEYNAVTMPSHPEQPGVVANIGLNGVMGINAKAGNAADAWKFLKFINGEDWARAKGKNNYQMVSRKKYIKPKEGSDLHMEAFLNVKPLLDNPNEMYKIYREKPYIFQVYDLGRTEYMDAVKGNKSIREALKSWQTKGDVMLQQMKDNPNMNGGNVMAVPAAG